MGDLDDKLKQISEILNDEEAQNNLKNLLKSFTGNEPSTNDFGDENELPVSSPSSTQDIDMILKAKNIMGKINSNKDSRIDLLNAIQPFLRNKRQAQCKNCINILKISDIVRMLSSFENNN